MILVGKTDTFERQYMEKFRLFASKFGEFVKYEYDRGARDIGLHLSHKLKSGQERMSSALCWFQMKGIMKDTLSTEDFSKNDTISLSLDVKHLQYWYLQPIATYLAVYVESVDIFLILNLKNYISEKWGRDILTLNQKTATVYVPTGSKLDEQAFYLILAKSDLEEWKKALAADGDNLQLCRRDYNLIWHLGTAQRRCVDHRIVFWEWQTKYRGQLYIQESLNQELATWISLREHWHYSGLTLNELQLQYPYVEFFSKSSEKT